MCRLRFLVLVLDLAIVLCSTSPDDDKSVAEYIISYGYAFQEHKVLTPDGYILTIWRIPCKLPLKRPLGPPVILQHGVLDNGFSFLFQDIKKNLPIMLVDQGGFDVWIGNIRGTMRSHEHVDKANHNWEKYGGNFWDFSWDEMATLDFPSIIDYVRRETGYARVKYIGHSQGCTMFFAFASLNVEYVNRCIDQAVFLAPAVFFSEQKSKIINQVTVEIIPMLEKANQKVFLADSDSRTLSKTLGENTPKAWLTFVNLVCGDTPIEMISGDRVSVLAANEFGGTSLQNLKHWVQQLSDPIVRMYDFGTAGNLQRYGVPIAPAYNFTHLEALKVPMMVFAFEYDTLIVVNAVKRLVAYLPNGTYYYEVIPGVNHVSGFWGDTAHKLLNPKIVAFFRRTVTNIA